MIKVDPFIAEKRRRYGRPAARAIHLTHVGVEAGALGLVGFVSGIGARVAAPALPGAVWGVWWAVGGLLLVAGYVTVPLAGRAARRATKEALGVAPVGVIQAESAESYATFCRANNLRPEPFDTRGQESGPVHSEPGETDRVVNAWLAAQTDPAGHPRRRVGPVAVVLVVTMAALPIAAGIADLAGARDIQRSESPVKGWPQVTGHVSNVKVYCYKSCSYTPTVAFTTTTGQTYSFTGPTDNGGQVMLGDQVSVSYNPADPGAHPHDLSADSMTYLWPKVFAFGLFGLDIGAVLIWGFVHMARSFIAEAEKENTVRATHMAGSSR